MRRTAIERQLDDYQELLQNNVRAEHRVAGLCGRIIKGSRSRDFRCLAEDPDRRLVLLMGEDGLSRLPGRTGYDMLVKIGHAPEHIEHTVDATGVQFKLIVFAQQDSARLATWDNVVDCAAQVYPEVSERLWRHLPKLKHSTFEELEHVAGFNFCEVNKIGRTDERFMTFERYLSSDDSLSAARAFLYFTVRLGELYAGDGYTRTHCGKRGVKEYIIVNRSLRELGDHRLIDIDVQIPEGVQETGPHGLQYEHKYIFPMRELIESAFHMGQGSHMLFLSSLFGQLQGNSYAYCPISGVGSNARWDLSHRYRL